MFFYDISFPTSKAGLGFDRNERAIQWITKLFIEFVVVETKQFVSSNSNVILTR